MNRKDELLLLCEEIFDNQAITFEVDDLGIDKVSKLRHYQITLNIEDSIDRRGSYEGGDGKDERNEEIMIVTNIRFGNQLFNIEDLRVVDIVERGHEITFISIA